MAVALALLAFTAPPALAHKMKLFATAEGAVVSGYVYFSPGGRARDAAVRAVAPDGAVVFQGRTDGDGAFRFDAGRRADLRISADGGDGHETSFTVRADELPPGLPALPATGAAPAPLLTTGTAASPPPEELAALIERSVARQVRPLREQLDAYEQAVRWHDVAGGIGTIIGLAGLAYGFAARSGGRPRRSATPGKEKATP